MDSTAWQETGNYTETPSGAKYAEIGVAKGARSDGCIYADDFSIETNIGVPKTNHRPGCNLDQYMEPFWRSDTVYNETVLMYSINGKPAEGKLLFVPSARALASLAPLPTARDFSLYSTVSYSDEYFPHRAFGNANCCN